MHSLIGIIFSMAVKCILISLTPVWRFILQEVWRTVLQFRTETHCQFHQQEDILCLRTYSKGLDTWNEKAADLGRLLMRMSFR